MGVGGGFVRLLSGGGGGRRIILPIAPNPRSAKKVSLSLVSNLMRSYRYCRAGAEYTEKLASDNAIMVFLSFVSVTPTSGYFFDRFETTEPRVEVFDTFWLVLKNRRLFHAE